MTTFTTIMKTTTLLTIVMGLMTSCIYNQIEPPIDCVVDGPQLTLDQKTGANCGADDGEVVLTAFGGDGNYSYSSGQHPTQNNGTFSNLAAGNYNFYVADGNLCTDTLEVAILNLDGVTIQSVTTAVSGCEGSNGLITIAGQDGVLPYMYQINGGSFQTNSSFGNLIAGTYTVAIKDATDCEFTQNVDILTGISFMNTISPIIANNCAVTGCHNGTQFPDFTMFENVQANADNIKSRTSSRSMPVGGTLTQTEIDQIACWVDDGALDN